MRPIQRAVTLLLLVVFTPLVVAQDKPTINVRDADGKLVGTVLAETLDLAMTQGLNEKSPLWVVRKTGDNWIFLFVTEKAVRGTKAFTPFLYENDLCSGPPLLEAPKTADQVSPTAAFDTQVYWSVGPASDRVIRSRGVMMRDPDACEGTLLDGNLCCTVATTAESKFAGDAGSIALAQLDFRPPFHLEVVPARQAGEAGSTQR
jgi:hypothetical protein